MTWPILKVGSRGAEIGNWQRFLNEQNATDWNGKTLIVDEAFGMRTTYATRQWQTKNGLPANGEVSDRERTTARKDGFVPFIQAANLTLVYLNPVLRPIDVIVIHTMESSEKPGTAEAVARWFAGASAPRASAHYCIDPSPLDSPLSPVVQCVRDADVAWHAPGCNHNGIGIEHAGRAVQTTADWEDEASRAILRTSALLAAKLAKRYGIPVVKLSPDDLKAKKRGFCGHFDATMAFPGIGRSHWDPGLAWPWQPYLDDVDTNLTRLG